MKMDIVSYLLELIETRKIVGINALGTLYKKKTPGRYDTETHSFLPPKYEISFTTEVKEDQDLVNFISEKRNISIESANYYITEFVENIHAQLADHQQADFSPLGELKLINDQIVLESSKTIEIGFDFYGLPSVAIDKEQPQSTEAVAQPPIDIEENQESEKELNAEITEEPDTEIEETKSSIEEQTYDQSIYDEIAEVNNVQELNEKEERVDLEKDQSATITEITDPLWKPTVINRYEYDDEDEDENSGRGLRFFLKTVGALIALVAVAGMIVYFLFPDLFYTIKSNIFNEQVKSHSTLMADTSSNHKIDSTATDSTKKAVTLPSIVKDSLNRDSLNHESLNKTTVYEVIGSAMKTQKKVDEVISNLAKRGINAKKMESMPGRLIKISLGTFTDYNVAKKFQDSLKIKLRNPEIYIQTIKPKN